MFEEFIAQGNDMIRRQQAQVGLSAYSAENIPDDQRVTIIEANAWRVAVEERIQNAFGPDAYARYKVFWEILSDDIEKKKGDESSRYVSLWRRIVSYLAELDDRLATGDQGTHSPDIDKRKRKVG
jgi:hypothetical protein